jgi:hypothetical protein
MNAQGAPDSSLRGTLEMGRIPMTIRDAFFGWRNSNARLPSVMASMTSLGVPPNRATP